MSDTDHPGYFYFYSGYLSQFTKAPFTVAGNDYICCEQAMMHQKALLFDDTEVAQKILRESNPAKIKALGRKVKNFKEAKWNKHKEQIVYDNNLAKFTQNSELRNRLLTTYPRILVEAASNDCIWGIGYNAETAETVPVSSWGQNLLGQILTKVRDNIRNDDY